MTQSSYRNIISIALPVLLANLAMPIQSTIDIAIVGHFSDISQLAGMGIAIQLIAILLVSFNFLQYSSSGLSAQVIGNYYTANNTNAIQSIETKNSQLFAILQRALVLAIVLGIAIMALQKWLIPIGLNVIGANNDSAGIASHYLSIRIWGIVAELMNYAFLGWFAGQGKTKFMLYQQSFIACANVVLTLTLVYGFDMTIGGVALGTTLAYWLGIVIAIIFACQTLNMRITNFILIDKSRFTIDSLMTLFSLNRDIFIRTILLTLSFAWITRLSAMSGDIVLAVNALLLQVLSLSAYALDGLAIATETLTGQFKGKSNKALTTLTDADLQNKQSQDKQAQIFKIILTRTFLASFALAVGLSIIWWLAMPTYLSSMTNLSEVYQLAYQYRWYAIGLPIIGVGAYWIDGVFFGLTDGSSIRNASIVVSLVFFPSSWLLYTAYELTGIWVSIWLILLLRFFILLVMLFFKLTRHSSTKSFERS